MSVDMKVPEIRFEGFSGEWEESPLSKFIASLDAGVSVNSGDKPAGEGGLGILKTSCVTNGIFKPSENKVVSDSRETNRLKEPVLKNTIIISRMNTPALVGANAYIYRSYSNYFLPDRLWAAKPTTVGDLQFIANILGSDRGREALSDLATGTSGSMKNISKPSVLRLKFHVPKDPEQTQIGNTFQKLDSLINQHQQKHDKLSSIKKVMLEKMFPKQGETTPEIRFKGFSGEWESKVLGSVASFYKGKDLPKSSIKYDGVYPCIHYGELFTKYSEVIQIITSRTNQNDNFFSISNDVLMPTSDVTPKGLVKSCCVKQNGVVLGGDILVIRPNDQNVIDGAFLSRFIRTREQQVLQKVTGSTVFHLYASSIENLDIVFPSIEEQKAIGNYFQQLDVLISQHQQQIIKLNNIKQACLRKMFV